jgi:hypothetical protein
LKKLFFTLFAILPLLSFAKDNENQVAKETKINQSEKAIDVFLHNGIGVKDSTTQIAASNVIYYSKNSIVSGINQISSQSHINQNTLLYSNIDQIHISSKTYVYFKAIETHSNNEANIAKLFSIQKADSKQDNTVKAAIVNPKKTTKTITRCVAYNQSFNGINKNSLNTLAVVTTTSNHKNNKHFIVTKTTKITNSSALSTVLKTTYLNYNVHEVEKHIFKYTFSLPPPFLC